MAARLNPRHQTMVREKIRAANLIKALEEHVFEGRVMAPSAVTAALGLLKKCVPDLSATELTGAPDEEGNPQPVTHRVVFGQ